MCQIDLFKINFKRIFDIKYILFNCDSFRQTHPEYFQTNNLKDLFKNIKPGDILSFLKKKKKTNFSLKSDKINLTKIWCNIIKYYKNSYPRPYIEDKTI